MLIIEVYREDVTRMEVRSQIERTMNARMVKKSEWENGDSISVSIMRKLKILDYKTC